MASATNILVFKGDQNALKQQAISAEGLVVVDFQASWCPSCRQLSQQLPAIANDFPNVLFLKADVDEAKDLSATYEISAIPHLKFFQMRDGQLHELASVTGANVPRIRECLRTHAANP
jgi:suppressor of tumorigenicity protein 13